MPIKTLAGRCTLTIYVATTSVVLLKTKNLQGGTDIDQLRKIM